MFRIWMQIALIAGVAAAIGGLYWRMVHLETENKELHAKLAIANRTIVAQDQAAREVREIRLNERHLINEIEATPEDQDNITAPVLLDAINRLH